MRTALAAGRSIAITAIVACGGGSGTPTAPPPPVVPPPVVANPDANLPGRIVYTLAGRIHIYTVATRANVDLNTTGINPKLSPDGSAIVYQFSGGIGYMSSEGTNKRTLSASGGVPSFSPSGTMVAFGDRTSGVWKVGVDGTGHTQLTADGGFQPAWSPDGARIAYNATVTGLGQQLFIVNADGSGRQHALTSNAIIDVVWSPSSRILFGLLVEDLNYEIHSYDPSVPTSLTRLTTRAENDFEPSWSPDEKNISWSNVSGGLWIMKADGSEAHQVVTGGRQGSWGK